MVGSWWLLIGNFLAFTHSRPSQVKSMTTKQTNYKFTLYGNIFEFCDFTNELSVGSQLELLCFFWNLGILGLTTNSILYTNLFFFDNEALYFLTKTCHKPKVYEKDVINGRESSTAALAAARQTFTVSCCNNYWKVWLGLIFYWNNIEFFLHLYLLLRL